MNRAKWKVWHGNLYGANIALTCFCDGVDIHTRLAEKESHRTTNMREICTRLDELWSYLTANEKKLINYGKEHRKGKTISTARVESTINQLVDWRMERKQQMRWTQRGAQMLLHARCALRNGELGTYIGWSPLRISAEKLAA